MRFGISPLSLDFVIDKVLKDKGLAGLTQFKLSELMEGVAKAGYKHCEIIFDTVSYTHLTLPTTPYV